MSSFSHMQKAGVLLTLLTLKCFDTLNQDIHSGAIIFKIGGKIRKLWKI